MKLLKLITLGFFVFSGGLTYSQPNDPHLIGKDGLPAARSPRYETNYGRESENRESINRRQTPGAIDDVENRNQFEEEFSSEEEQNDYHFKSDTISIRFFHEKGNQTKNPQSIYRNPVKPDSVRSPSIGRDRIEVDSVDGAK